MLLLKPRVRNLLPTAPVQKTAEAWVREPGITKSGLYWRQNTVFPRPSAYPFRHVAHP